MLYLQLLVFLTDEHCRLSVPPRESFVQQNSSSSGTRHVTKNRKIHLTIMMLMCGRGERPFKTQMDFLFSSCICPLHAKYCLSDGAQLFILKYIIDSISVSPQTQQSSCCINMRESTLIIFNMFFPNNQCKRQKKKIVLRQWTQSCPSGECVMGICWGWQLSTKQCCSLDLHCVRNWINRKYGDGLLLDVAMLQISPETTSWLPHAFRF